MTKTSGLRLCLYDPLVKEACRPRCAFISTALILWYSSAVRCFQDRKWKLQMSAALLVAGPKQKVSSLWCFGCGFGLIPTCEECLVRTDSYGGFLKWGYPQIIQFSLQCTILNPKTILRAPHIHQAKSDTKITQSGTFVGRTNSLHVNARMASYKIWLKVWTGLNLNT